VGVSAVAYQEVTERLSDLVLGLQGERVTFCWRPYAERPASHRADYDRLVVSIYHQGIVCPLITWGSHVLIGQRRAEIGKRLGIDTVRCWRIREDVRQWHGADLLRLEALKRHCGAARY